MAFLIHSPLFGQVELDSVRVRRNNSLLTNPKRSLSVILDNRNSFIGSSAVKIYGLNVGVRFHRNKYRLGLGIYALRRNYEQLYFYSRRYQAQDTLSPTLSLFFMTPNFAYTFYNSRWLELSVPVEVGFGTSHFTVRNAKEQVVRERKGLFVPAEIGLGILLKPTRWVGIGGLIGYRKSLAEVDFKGDFDGLFYSYRLNIFLGNILQDVRKIRERKRQNRTLNPAFQP